MAIELQVRTTTHNELQDITSQVQQAVGQSGVRAGICHIFVPHTTAGVTLNENWDPDVRGDLVRALGAMVPAVSFQHGEGNSPAHLLSTLVGVSQTVLIDGGALALGTWQGVYLAEFDGPRRRRVLLKIVPDPE
jgi:secondary thiamine-phosphate synthase enzyme